MSVQAAIMGLSLGQRIAGAVLLLALWLAPAGATWLYMHGKASSQFELGKADAAATCAQRQVDALATAMADARAEWGRTQSAITDQAGKDARDLAKFLADARTRAGRISEEFRSYAAAHPLPAGCRADPGRVELYNRARAGGAPTR